MMKNIQVNYTTKLCGKKKSAPRLEEKRKKKKKMQPEKRAIIKQPSHAVIRLSFIPKYNVYVMYPYIDTEKNM